MWIAPKGSPENLVTRGRGNYNYEEAESLNCVQEKAWTQKLWKLRRANNGKRQTNNECIAVRRRGEIARSYQACGVTNRSKYDKGSAKKTATSSALNHSTLMPVCRRVWVRWTLNISFLSTCLRAVEFFKTTLIHFRCLLRFRLLVGRICLDCLSDGAHSLWHINVNCSDSPHIQYIHIPPVIPTCFKCIPGRSELTHGDYPLSVTSLHGGSSCLQIAATV